MLRRLGFLLGAMAAMAIAPLAKAAVVKVTVDGTVGTTYGNTALFGLPPSAIEGLTYQAVYLFDTSVGDLLKSPTFQSAVGGTFRDAPTPSLDATLTINGVTHHFPGGYKGVVSTANGGNFGAINAWAAAVDVPTAYHEDLRLYLNAPHANSLGVSLETPFTYDVDPSDVITSYFDYQVTDIDPKPCCIIHSAGAILKPSTISLQLASVPEPGAWALMLLGFALVGTAVRARSRTARANAG